MSDDNRVNPESVARLVRWMIIIFLVFVFFQNLPKFGIGDKPKPSPLDASPITVAGEKGDTRDCDGNVFNNFSLFAMPMFPVSSSTVAISDMKEGAGSRAVCGQKATIRYAYSRRDGDVIFSNLNSSAETTDVIIGGPEIIPGLSRGLIGMKAGGERDITIPPELGFAGVKHIESLRDHDKFKFGGIVSFLTARADLLSLTPAIPETPLKLRLIDQYLGTGKAVECGDEVSVKLTLWKMDGSSVYSNEKGEDLHFQVGASQLPYGIEQGVIGMMPGGSRTLIVPPAYMNHLIDADNQLLKDVTLPAGEIMLAVIQVADKVDPAKTPAAAKPADATQK